MVRRLRLKPNLPIKVDRGDFMNANSKIRFLIAAAVNIAVFAAMTIPMIVMAALSFSRETTSRRL